jgi:HD-GYP domain-containing protein (c-di-GMP phosphodiesterase class II)
MGVPASSLLPIRLGTLRPDAVLAFDLYVQVGAKSVHYLRQGDPLEKDRITRLKGKGVKKLFIRPEQEPAYLEYLDHGLNTLKGSSASVEEKATLVRDNLVGDAEGATKAVETQAGYARTQARMDKVVEFLTSDAGALQSVLGAAGCSLDNFQHSATVATLAVGLAPRCGLTAPADLNELGIAALLHDIGHTTLKLTPESSRTEYEKHPEAGAHLLAGKPYVTPSVLELIRDHEEMGEAAGFPRKVRLATLPLSSQVLNLCNDYDRYCMSKGKGAFGMAKEYFQEKIGLFDLAHMKALKALLEAR